MLSYGYRSEIWGVYVKHDFKAWDNTPIEKPHLKFCKRYLEIRKLKLQMLQVEVN